MTIAYVIEYISQMPYHGSDIRSSPIFSSNKRGRYVIDSAGVLRGVEGDRVDLHAFLTNHSSQVDLVAVKTEAMIMSGLFPNSFVLVNRGRKAYNGALVLVRYSNEVLIRRLEKKNNNWYLTADDRRIKDLPLSESVVVENLGVIEASLIRYVND